jgi:hypothetical protein
MKKHYIKLIGSTLIIGAFLILAYGSDDSELSYGTIANFEEAKERVDSDIAELDERYKELCGGVRNGAVKENFATLGLQISRTVGCEEKMTKLDFTVQKEVRIYYRNEMAKRPHFEELSSYGKIPCW